MFTFVRVIELDEIHYYVKLDQNLTGIFKLKATFLSKNTKIVLKVKDQDQMPPNWNGKCYAGVVWNGNQSITVDL